MATRSIPWWMIAALGLAVPACGGDEDDQADPDQWDPGEGVMPPYTDCPTPLGQTWFVSTDGDDAQAGSQEAPWRTLERAVATTSPGDTVYLLGGTWRERLIPRISGTPAQPIVFAAHPSSSRPIIDGTDHPDIDTGVIHLDGISYVTLCGLVVRNSAHNGVNIERDDEGVRPEGITVVGLDVENSDEAAIYARRAIDIVVENNRTRDSISSGVGIWISVGARVSGNTVINARNDDDRGHQEYISIADTENFEVFDNEITTEGPVTWRGHSAIDVKESSQHGRVYGNYIHDIAESGKIYLDAWEAGLEGTPTLNDIEVFANLLVSAGGVTVGSEQGGTVENIRIYNNVIVRSNSSGILIADSEGPKRDIYIYNNTIYDNVHHGIAGIYVISENAQHVVIQNNAVALDPDMTVGEIVAGYASLVPEITVDHNLVFGPKRCSHDYPDCVELSDLPGNTTADPRWVDAPGGDFHLLGDSPAIDQGVTIADIGEDFEGTTRPQGDAFDIGAFEYVP